MDDWRFFHDISPGDQQVVIAAISQLMNTTGSEDVLITKNGQPVEVLHGAGDSDDVQEFLLLNDPRFHAIMAQSRQEYRDGRFTRLEDIDK